MDKNICYYYYCVIFISTVSLGNSLATLGTTNASPIVGYEFEDGHLRPNFSVPSPLWAFMDQDKILTIEYTLPCVPDSRENVTVAIRSMSEHMFQVKSTAIAVLSCKRAPLIDDNRTENWSTTTTTERPSNDVGGNVNNDVIIVKGSVNVTIHAERIGASQLLLTYVRDQNQSDESAIGVPPIHAIPVIIIKFRRLIDQAFHFILITFIATVTFLFGCTIDFDIVKSHIKKPIGPAIGFGCQYLLMPLIACSVGKALPIKPASLAFGVFMCGVCPGGGLSNVYTYLLDGDVNLSVTMTFLSTLFSIVMMPAWTYTLGRVFLVDEFNIVIPYSTMAQVITSVTIPLLLGIIVNFKFKTLAGFMRKILRPATIVCVIIYTVACYYATWPIFKMFTALHIIYGSLVPYLGFFFGAVIATILRQPRDRVIAISFETGQQNLAIALVLLVMSFPPPEGDLASLAPIACGLMTGIWPVVALVGWTSYKACCRQKFAPVAKTDGNETKSRVTENRGTMNKDEIYELEYERNREQMIMVGMI